MSSRARAGQNASSSQSATICLTKTTTIVKINQKQSLNIIKTVVCATLSSIVYIRKLFPDDFFETRNYSLYKPNFPYTIVPKDVLKSTTALRKQFDDVTSVSWNILLRDKHHHSDKLLSWLDGVGDALERKYISTLQISFYDGPVSPDNTVETYVLSFSYAGPELEINLDLTSRHATVDITNEDEHDLQLMFQRLVSLMSGCKRLPQNPTVGMQITYNDTCPPEYEPLGFIATADPRLIVQEEGLEAGDMTTKFHKVGLQVISAPTGSSQTSAPAKKNFNQHLRADISAGGGPVEDGTALSQGLSTQFTQAGTQVIEERDLIRTMACSRAKVGDTQILDRTIPVRVDAQAYLTPSATASRSLQLSPERPKRTMFLSPPRQQSTITKTPNRVFQLSDETIFGFFEGQQFSGEVKSFSLDDTKINCHCGGKPGSKMMRCENCGEWQHRHCYGYMDSDELQSVHLCYTCLLGSGSGLLKEMKQLCLSRKTLHIILKEGYPMADRDLTSKIGCLVKDVKQITSDLVREKYLKVVWKESKKKKAIQPTQTVPPFEFIETERERLYTEYFNPVFGIEEYFANGKDARKSAKPKRNQVTDAPDMVISPPPVKKNPKLHPEVPSTPTARAGSSTQGTPSYAESPRLNKSAAIANMLPRKRLAEEFDESSSKFSATKSPFVFNSRFCR